MEVYKRLLLECIERHLIWVVLQICLRTYCTKNWLLYGDTDDFEGTDCTISGVTTSQVICWFYTPQMFDI